MAFLSRVSRSSGRDGANPACFIVLVMVFPAIGLVRGIPCWSRSIVPILLGLCPSLASLIIMASTSSGVYLHHIGVRFPTGRVGCDFPFSVLGIVCSSERLFNCDCLGVFKNIVDWYCGLGSRRGS